MKNILKLIGDTPILELTTFSKNKNVKIYAKIKGNNPGGSVKDRIAKYMFLDAIKNKKINKSQTIIEATSGNTGIGLAMITSIFGYKFIAVMPESVSIERRKILKQYGADIILTDGNKGTNYSIEIAKQMVSNEPEKFFMLNQFEDYMNVFAHYDSTGKEIIKQMPSVTHFVTGLGTGGTIMGVGKRLKEYNKNIKVIGVEPIPNSKIQGLRNMNAYKPPIFQVSSLDEILQLTDDEIVFGLSRELALMEGISVGISSGASLWASLQIAKRLKHGIIVTVFPDKADRYVSTDLFN